MASICLWACRHATHVCDWLQAELKRPRFEEGLEGVLDLANSISLNDLLQAADIDTGLHQGISDAEEEDGQAAEGFIDGAAPNLSVEGMHGRTALHV